MRPGGSPGRTAADQPVAAAVQPNATERPLPARFEPAACSRGRITVKRYALTAGVASEPKPMPRGSVALLLVDARFIIGEASGPGFPQPIGTAVRHAGQAAWSRRADEPNEGEARCRNAGAKPARRSAVAGRRLTRW